MSLPARANRRSLIARAGYKVTGIDLSEDMLKIARKHNKYENLKFVSGDATSLPYDDNGFDVACVSLALHDMPAAIREKVVSEMVRVTRPGGTIIAVDYALPKNKISAWFAYRLIKAYESKYYPDFIKNDMLKLLEERGVRIAGGAPPDVRDGKDCKRSKGWLKYGMGGGACG